MRIPLLALLVFISCNRPIDKPIAVVDMQAPATKLGMSIEDQTRIGKLVTFVKPQLGIDHAGEVMSAAVSARHVTVELLTLLPGYYFGHPWMTSGVVTDGIKHSFDPQGGPMTGFGLTVDGQVVGVTAYDDLKVQPGMNVELVGYLAGVESMPRLMIAHTVAKRGTFEAALKRLKRQNAEDKE